VLPVRVKIILLGLFFTRKIWFDFCDDRPKLKPRIVKKIMNALFLFVSTTICGQSKTVTIVDSLTHKPIGLAHLSYPLLKTGSISNDDGRVKMVLQNEDLVISHINYGDRKISFDSFLKKDTIFLKAKNNELDEIVLYTVDLKKKLGFVLDNYRDLYFTKSLLKECTYKESFKINDSLSRLFQIQLNWWSKHNLFNPKKPFKKENKLFIENVDYSKVKITENLVSKGYIENSAFFRILQLNFLLSILKNNADAILITSVRKNKLTTEIIFDADYIERNKKLYSYKNSIIVFDKKSGAVNHIKLNMEYYTDFKKHESREKALSYKSRTTFHSEELSFKKLWNGKLSLNYFISTIKGEVKERAKKYNFAGSQKLFITKTEKKKKFKHNAIDLDKPFYESVPKSSHKNNKILLTKKEEVFVKNE